MYRIFILRFVAALAGGIIANKKGRNKFIWALLCFVFPPLVLVILILQPKVASGKTKKCPYCTKVINENEAVCRYCEKELPINLVQCKQCGSFVPEKNYCVNCNKQKPENSY